MYRNIVYLSKQKLMRLYTWDNQGNRQHIDTAYQPYLYTETNGPGDAISIFNTQLKKRTFNSQFERNNFVKTCSTSRIFENLSVQQQFLIDTFWSVNDKPEFTQNKLKTWFLDIETDTLNYKPDHKLKIRKKSKV